MEGGGVLVCVRACGLKLVNLDGQPALLFPALRILGGFNRVRQGVLHVSLSAPGCSAGRRSWIRSALPAGAAHLTQ